MQVLLMFALCHVLPVGLAIWGAFSRSPRIHVPAILVLMSDLIGYSLAGLIGFDNFPSHMAWLMVGPLFAPVELSIAIVEAPLWVIPLLLLGTSVGVITWRWLWRSAASRAWTFAAVIASLFGTVFVAEIAVEIVLRFQALKIENICRFQRSLTPVMFGAGLSERRATWPPHGQVTNGDTLYHWSFVAGDWVPERSCAVGTTSACSCPGRQ